MEFDVVLKELLELGKKNQGFIYSVDILKYCSEESDEYDALEKELAKSEIDILPSTQIVEDFDLTIGDEPNIIEVEEIDVSTFDQLPASVKVDDPVRMYLKEIGNIQLLNIEEETELAKDVVEGRIAKEKIAQIEADDQNTVSAEEYEVLLDIVDKAEMAKGSFSKCEPSFGCIHREALFRPWSTILGFNSGR